MNYRIAEDRRTAIGFERVRMTRDESFRVSDMAVYNLASSINLLPIEGTIQTMTVQRE